MMCTYQVTHDFKLQSRPIHPHVCPQGPLPAAHHPGDLPHHQVGQPLVCGISAIAVTVHAAPNALTYWLQKSCICKAFFKVRITSAMFLQCTIGLACSFSNSVRAVQHRIVVHIAQVFGTQTCTPEADKAKQTSESHSAIAHR